MRALLVLLLVMLTAATALAYTNETLTTVSVMAVQVARSASEPAALLLSGSFLLGLAGAVRRFTF